MDFRLDRENVLFLFIDIQGTLAAAVERIDRVNKYAGILAEAAEIMQIPAVFTTQYKKGLGGFDEAIRGKVTAAADFDKKAFSCMLDEEIAAYFDEKKPKQVVVCGIEAHICVLMTVRDLIAKGYDVYVAHDAVSSRSGENALYAFEEMRQMGAAIRSTESILFDLNSVSGTAEFKAVQQLIK